MFKFLNTVCSLVFLVGVMPAFAQDNTDSVKLLVRPKMTSNFTSNKNSIDFETSGFKVDYKVNDNLAIGFLPAFIRTSALSGVATTGNDTVSFFIIDANFRIKDVTKGNGDYGIGLTVGQFETPLYKIEQKYQPFRFIYKPLDYKTLPNDYAALGVMLNDSFFGEKLNMWLGYTSGAGIWNGELSTAALNDNINAGGILLTTTFYPFKDGNEAIKDLSFTLHLNAIMRTKARSNYNFLLGYKYRKFATSFEYLNTYSSLRSKDITATSLGASYDLCGPFQLLGRWDYTDNNSATVHLDHFFLLGLNTKWYAGKLQAALTFDQEYDPSHKTTPAKRMLLSTQFYY